MMFFVLMMIFSKLCFCSERTVFIMPPDPTGLPEGKTYRYAFCVDFYLMEIYEPYKKI